MNEWYKEDLAFIHVSLVAHTTQHSTASPDFFANQLNSQTFLQFHLQKEDCHQGRTF